MHGLSAQAQYFLDLLGIFGFALSGAYLGVRKDFNLFGTLVLAEAAGLGGGLVRDLVLQVPSIAFTDPGYPLAPLAAALLAYRSKSLHRQPHLFDLLDAIGLGLFSVTGTIKGLQHGMEAVPSAALGVITAMGGGILASAVAKELPSSLRWDSDLYALPAIAGAVAAAALHEARALDIMTASGAALTAFTLRLLALHFHWRSRRSTAWRAASSPLSALPDANSPLIASSRSTVADTMRLRVIPPPPHGRSTGQRSPAPLADTMRLRAISPPPGRTPGQRSPAPLDETTRMVQPGPADHRLPRGPHHSASPQTLPAGGHPTRGPERA
ncbi:TRIC cation channel family protein [Streptomyces sp. NA02950]|uniref:trimeric intracellular cation channel family protein n=1 Tax=Streptomyces sp. NA02950 TaxID=2742137 RepID=UPI00159083DF|nr:TRIC cation channel family protein [Streptomyces sp. NA02950]